MDIFDFEVLLVEAFDILFYKTMIPVLMITAVAGALTGAVVLVANRDQNVRGTNPLADIAVEQNACILNSVSKTLKWLFHEWIRIILLVAFLATILYSLIFVYSMCKWKGMLPKQEYEQALTDSSEYNHLPLSRPTNLIGAQRDEIEYEFGIAEREGFIRKYGGIREDGREYCIRVFYLPVVERVLWYETLIYIG